MTNPSQLHVDTYKHLHDVLEPYHEKLNNLDAQITQLGHDRAVVNATLLHELASLKLTSEVIGALAARCW